MTTSKCDWIVTTYNDLGTRKGCFKIENRTEREATKEAEASVEVRYAHDWTLTPIKKKLIVSVRDKELLRMAVTYLLPNLDDAIEAFETEESRESENSVREISVDGDVISTPTEEEISLLFKHF